VDILVDRREPVHQWHADRYSPGVRSRVSGVQWLRGPAYRTRQPIPFFVYRRGGLARHPPVFGRYLGCSDTVW